MPKAQIDFTRSDTRFAVVRELVNTLVPDTTDRKMVMDAVFEYGKASASEALDAVKVAMGEAYAPVGVDDPDVLDRVAERG